MNPSIQILLGLLVGGIGFFQIADNPFPGCIALLVSGFMILAGVDQLGRVKGKEERGL